MLASLRSDSFFVEHTPVLRGSVTIPASKSHTLRAMVFGLLANGKSHIHNYLPSPDTNAMIAACRKLGASVEISPDCLDIVGTGGKIQAPDDVIHTGNSGIMLRFLTALATLSSQHTVITGDHSIRHQRPMQPVIDAISQLGGTAISTRGNGYAPLVVKGPLKAGQAFFCGKDSQPVSAMLIAGSFAEGPITLHIRDAGEKPWVAMTLSWLDRLGILYKNQDYDTFHLPGKASIQGFHYSVPGDLSSAAFPIAAALVTQSELLVRNVDLSDCQGDKKLISSLQEMGAQLEIDAIAKTVHVKKGSRLQGATLDINEYIDSIAILAVFACFAEGTTHIKSAAVARTKECDRIKCVCMELKKMGADITETADGLIIKSSQLRGAYVSSHHDHRLAMSLTIAALGASGQSCVQNVGCINKTYPHFFEHFNAIGALIKNC